MTPSNADHVDEHGGTAGIDTLGGLPTALLGRFPAVGDDLVIEGRAVRVEARDGLRVSSVRLLPQGD